MNTDVITQLAQAARGMQKHAIAPTFLGRMGRFLGNTAGKAFGALFTKGPQVASHVPPPPAAAKAGPGFLSMFGQGFGRQLQPRHLSLTSPGGLAALGTAGVGGAWGLGQGLYNRSTYQPGREWFNPMSWFNPTSTAQAFRNNQDAHSQLRDQVKNEILQAANRGDMSTVAELRQKMDSGSYGGWGMGGWNPWGMQSEKHYAQNMRDIAGKDESAMDTIQQLMKERGIKELPNNEFPQQGADPLARSLYDIRKRMAAAKGLPDYGGQVQQNMESTNQSQGMPASHWTAGSRPGEGMSQGMFNPLAMSQPGDWRPQPRWGQALDTGSPDRGFGMQ